MARLYVESSEGTRVVELAAHNTLGRHPGNTVQLLDKIVSKEHCIIDAQGDGFVLKDLGSLNGTFVNQERVRGQIPLRHGDEISLGATRLRFDASVARVSGPLGTAVMGGVAPGSSPPKQNPFNAHGTRIDVADEERFIGAELAAVQEHFVPFDQVARFPEQLRADYERLRLAYELTAEVARERDLDVLLSRILASVIRHIQADRGVILLRDETGELVPRASQRRDGSGDAIRLSSTILDKVVRERTVVLTHNASEDFAGSKAKSMILNRINSAIVAPLLHDQEKEVLGVMWLDSEALAQFKEKDLEVVSAIAQQAAMFIEVNVLGQKVQAEILMRERFTRLLSPNIAERIVSGQLEIAPGGQRVDLCTVFNSDIRGFTSMSEEARPEELVEMLNEYFEAMVDVIFRYEGTLDKFMGDGIMALWGAPVVHRDDAVRAVDCALQMQTVLRLLNLKRTERGQQPLEIGIGIHTGPLVAGYIGSSRALSYTVVGDTANTSARLCAVAAPGQILISEATLAVVGDGFVVEELDPVKLKGKEHPVRIYQVIRKVTLSGPPNSTTTFSSQEGTD